MLRPVIFLHDGAYIFGGGMAMNCRLSELRRKEVISAVDGVRIGYIDDVIVDTKTASIVEYLDDFSSSEYSGNVRIILFRGRKLT